MAFASSRRDQERIPIAFQRSHTFTSTHHKHKHNNHTTPIITYTTTAARMPLNRSSSNSERNTSATQSSNTTSNTKNMRKAHSIEYTSPSALQNQKVDRFGFITNIDSNGKILPTAENTNNPNNNGNNNNNNNSSSSTSLQSSATLLAEEEIKRNERREKKWATMMQSWDVTHRRRQKLVLNRLRKGLPDSMRGKVWPLLGGVPKKLRQGSSTRGIYKALLRQCEQDNQNALDHMPPEGPNKSLSRLTLTMRSNSFQNIQETIERDIHRTFPRHSLFYDEENHKDDLPPPPPSSDTKEQQSKNGDNDDDDDDDSQAGFGGLCNEDLSTLMRELEVGTSPFEDKKKKSNNKKGGLGASSQHDKKPAAGNASNLKNANKNTNGKGQRESVTCETMVEAKGGQAALRRVLCAYSYYDREVGYCQGMNFIAAMFITIMSEEEAFWMLVAVMNESPCRLRGLFGKGMTETHKVLHVAEKLIHHFLPKLAKHLDKENVHVTMYATQWLLTQYTSSFNFDLVTRVWDCFLVEGFKTIYRVMLALLQQVQPILLKKSFEEILGFFRDLPDHVDGNSVMETALKVPLKRKHIARYESEWYAEHNKNNK